MQSKLLVESINTLLSPKLSPFLKVLTIFPFKIQLTSPSLTMYRHCAGSPSLTIYFPSSKLSLYKEEHNKVFCVFSILANIGILSINFLFLQNLFLLYVQLFS